MLLLKIKQKVVEYGEKIVKEGLVVATWGNISARNGHDDVFVITPSGMSYTILEPDDIVEVDINGNPLSPGRKPSVETPMHAAIYRARPDVRAIIHTHSTNACACAVARMDIPCIMEDMACMVGGPVKVADYAPTGSQELARNVVKALGDRNAVLLANHGVVTVGRDLEEAFKLSLLVEKSAEIFIKAKLIRFPFSLNESEVQFLRNFYRTSYGQGDKK
ncbi:class II aldolase/adducin family protein [Thermosediminibacter oceani]|uniref:Class II aldolase/adducin family protein n=1 Tax=Thermosediminibacter oceani (strain ATCC BAA-1034 / DSM 16646 / JW/IW-1228P) TaxID=555079 RepID=D9S0Y2_THEOJ|nr:class II aldolase/adducin family protein [Thermosediminibacter oceani]ADL07146.1 class II aldolase/adducin family protein [Thermosediminibacter oceani DSM 16646]